MEIPSDYLANHAHTCNADVNKCAVNDKTMDGDLVITDNVMYNVGLQNETNGKNCNSLSSMNKSGKGRNHDAASGVEESNANIYHDINETIL